VSKCGSDRQPCGLASYRPSAEATSVATQGPTNWQTISRAPVDDEGWDRVRYVMTWPPGFTLDWQLCVEGADGDLVPVATAAGDASGAVSPLAEYCGSVLLRARIPAAAPPSPVALRWSYRRHSVWRCCCEE
jgi:hypothetical protein